jgi:hypothetical protein
MQRRTTRRGWREQDVRRRISAVVGRPWSQRIAGIRHRGLGQDAPPGMERGRKVEVVGGLIGRVCHEGEDERGSAGGEADDRRDGRQLQC